MLRAAGLPHRAKACRPRAVHYSSQADDVGSSSDGEQTLSDDDADGLTVSSSVSGTPQSAAAIASPPRVGVPGCPGPSQLISSLEAFHSDDASLADSLFFLFSSGAIFSFLMFYYFYSILYVLLLL